MQLATYVLVSMLLMFLDHRQNHLETLRSGLSTVLYPLQFAVHVPFRTGRWLSENMVTRQSLQEENRELKQQYLITQARISRFDALEAENRRLRSLLDSSAKLTDRVLVAEVIAVEMDPFSHLIMLNKGTNDGVKQGQPIIDAQGIMGQVVHVNPLSSSALLITDPSHALPIQINRNGLRALATGRGASNTLELLHLPNNADVLVGDLVVTSGLGQRFPSGYPVGTVSDIKVEVGQPFAHVVVTPTASLEKNREVLLLWPGEGPPVKAVPDEQGSAP